MKFNAHGGISILELFLYFPSFLVAVYICYRHGFGRSSGWIFTLILCLIRIIGACCQLATYHSESQGLFETTIILDSVGVSPLLLATLGLLSRCIDSIKETSTFPLSAIHFRLIQLLITIGLILSIAGGSNGTSSDGTFKVQTTSKVGIILYIVAYVALALTALLTSFKLSHAESGEKRLLLAVILALPFILVRLVYSTLAALTHFHDFNLLTGSVAIFAIMAVAMEFAVILIYLVIGWRTNVIPASQRGPIMSRPWKGNLDGAISRPGGRRGRRQGPIHGLVSAAVAAAQQQPAQQSR
ncbi:hypothetical protein OEA41_006812 [Lepraria neglecta]|uniref:DUF7702 domain-containing protein n=1 Tax=Lepraria neglecta TaxID=209136 RepID=A0AAD9ZC62_9LECA|nr:hypothetical protein OEA41_006812 [Lepraria neglecta]